MPRPRRALQSVYQSMWSRSTIECDFIATLSRSFSRITLQCRLVGLDVCTPTNRRLVMSFNSLRFTQRALAAEESLEANKVRTLVAKHLKVDLKRVTDEAHFRDDLGADWLDRLELMMLIEDQFAGVEIGDNDADQIEVVSDLIRYIEDESVSAVT